jgi:hypothetical protein
MLTPLDATAQGRTTRIAPGVTFTPLSPARPTTLAPGVTYTPYSTLGQSGAGTLAPGVTFSSIGPGSTPGPFLPEGLAFNPLLAGGGRLAMNVAPGVLFVPGNPAQSVPGLSEGNVVTTATSIPAAENLIVPATQLYTSYSQPLWLTSRPFYTTAPSYQYGPSNSMGANISPGMSMPNPGIIVR